MSVDRAIIMAAGQGSRLFPSTRVVGKCLLPVYDRPMICYPLATLIEAGIRRFLIVVRREDLRGFSELLGDGRRWGVEIEYKVQSPAWGIADAFRIGRDWIDGRPVGLMLGDNLFWGGGFEEELRSVVSSFEGGACVFAREVDDPSRYGVIGWNELGVPESIEEKPREPRSSFAVVGCYVFDEGVCEIAMGVGMSDRGELEITDVNRVYLERGTLDVRVLSRSVFWLDMGTHDDLLRASLFVAERKREGERVGELIGVD
jgi:glucose-1-phosphate thymidylyltransferase